MTSSEELRVRAETESLFGADFDSDVPPNRDTLDQFIRTCDKQSHALSRLDDMLFEALSTRLAETQLARLPRIAAQASIKRLMVDPLVQLWLKPKYNLDILPLLTFVNGADGNENLAALVAGVGSQYQSTLQRLRAESARALRDWVKKCEQGSAVDESWHAAGQRVFAIIDQLQNTYQRAYDSITAALPGEQGILLRNHVASTSSLYGRLPYSRVLPLVYYASTSASEPAANSNASADALADMLAEVLVLHDRSFANEHEYELERGRAWAVYGRRVFDFSSNQFDRDRDPAKRSAYLKKAHKRSMAIEHELGQLLDLKPVRKVMWARLNATRDRKLRASESELDKKPTFARRRLIGLNVPDVMESVPAPITKDDVRIWADFANISDDQIATLHDIHDRYLDTCTRRFTPLVARLYEMDIGVRPDESRGMIRVFSDIDSVNEGTELLMRLVDVITKEDDRFFAACKTSGVFRNQHNYEVVIQLDRELDRYGHRWKEPNFSKRLNLQALALLSDVDRVNPLDMLFSHEPDDRTKSRVIALSNIHREALVNHARASYDSALAIWCKSAALYSRYGHVVIRKDRPIPRESMSALRNVLAEHKSAFYSNRNQYIRVMNEYVAGLYEALGPAQARHEFRSDYVARAYPIVAYDPYKFQQRKVEAFKRLESRGGDLANFFVQIVASYEDEYVHLQDTLMGLSQEYESLLGLNDRDQELSAVRGQVEAALIARRELNLFTQRRMDLLFN
ncbi:MAG: hypothetical protein IID30_11765 [Planctomycetes bacterium]|nr:hypothetical protein [Planctomycetota bacterium]